MLECSDLDVYYGDLQALWGVSLAVEQGDAVDGLLTHLVGEQAERLGAGAHAPGFFDGAVAGSEVDGPQRASDARWMARKLLAG